MGRCVHGLVGKSDFIQTKSKNCEPLYQPGGTVMVEGYYCSYLEHGMVNASLNEPRWRTLVNHRYVHRTVAVFSVFEFFSK